jgi:hypothetical protein
MKVVNQYCERCKQNNVSCNENYSHQKKFICHYCEKWIIRAGMVRASEMIIYNHTHLYDCQLDKCDVCYNILYISKDITHPKIMKLVVSDEQARDDMERIRNSRNKEEMKKLREMGIYDQVMEMYKIPIYNFCDFY